MTTSPLTITDPRGATKTIFQPLADRVTPHLTDARDVVVVQDILKASVLALLGLSLFVPGVFSWWLAALYLVLLIPRLGPLAIIVHLTSHRMLFKRPWRRLNAYVPWFLVLFYGITPGGYFAHHVGMHHPEENVGPDSSKTLRYRRDSLGSFVLYLLRFVAFGKWELIAYLHKKQKLKILRRFLLGELIHKTVIILALLIHWQAALAVIIAPYLILRYGLMMGNWTEHAFIDPDEPENPYKNSFTLVNCHYNRAMYNDGYHCTHHIRQGAHWADLPGDFEKDFSSYVQHQAVIFDGIRGLQVMWCHLMLRRYDVMAKHLVSIGGIPTSIEDRIAWLKKRTAPIPA
jgi:fatty acid desaturase